MNFVCKPLTLRTIPFTSACSFATLILVRDSTPMHLALAEYNFQYNVRSGDFIFIAFYFVLSKRESCL